MRARGQVADMLIEIVPDVYKKYATTDKKGNTIIYVKLLQYYMD